MLKFGKGEILLKEPIREPFTAITVREEAEIFIFYLQGYSCLRKYQEFDHRTYGILPCGDRVLSCICEDDTLYYIDEEPTYYA